MSECWHNVTFSCFTLPGWNIQSGKLCFSCCQGKTDIKGFTEHTVFSLFLTTLQLISIWRNLNRPWHYMYQTLISIYDLLQFNILITTFYKKLIHAMCIFRRNLYIFNIFRTHAHLQVGHWYLDVYGYMWLLENVISQRARGTVPEKCIMYSALHNILSKTTLDSVTAFPKVR